MTTKEQPTCISAEQPKREPTVGLSLAPDGRLVVHLSTDRASHTVRLTPDARGLAALVSILTRRQATESRGISADMAAPTQSIVDAWLREHTPSRTVREPAARDEISPSEADELLSGLSLTF